MASIISTPNSKLTQEEKELKARRLARRAANKAAVEARRAAVCAMCYPNPDAT